MSKRQKVKQHKRALERQEKSVLKKLADKRAERESIERDRKDTKREVERIERRQDADKPINEEKLKGLEVELVQYAYELKRIRERLAALRTRRKKVARKIKKAARKLRNLARPRLIDLKLDFGGMATQGSISRVIGHYTAGPQDDDTDDAIRLCRIYHQAHRNKGWAGEAYLVNFTVDGDILLLRPSWAVGAHTYNYNTGSLGPMCHGTTGDKPTRSQLRAMRYWAKKGHTKRFGNHRAQVQPKRLRWYGHNDFNATGCPGSFKTAYLSKGAKR